MTLWCEPAWWPQRSHTGISSPTWTPGTQVYSAPWLISTLLHLGGSPQPSLRHSSPVYYSICLQLWTLDAELGRARRSSAAANGLNVHGGRVRLSGIPAGSRAGSHPAAGSDGDPHAHAAQRLRARGERRVAGELGLAVRHHHDGDAVAGHLAQQDLGRPPCSRRFSRSWLSELARPSIQDRIGRCL